MSVHQFVLEKATATKLSTGKYKWSLSHQNTVHVPRSVKVGPVSITSTIDQRSYLIESEDFTKSDRAMVRRGDTLKPVLCMVHPYNRVKLDIVQNTTLVDAAYLEAQCAFWFDASTMTYFTLAGVNLSRFDSRIPASNLNLQTSGTDETKVVDFGDIYAVTEVTGASTTTLKDSSWSNNPASLANGADIIMFRTPSDVVTFAPGTKHRYLEWGIQYCRIVYLIAFDTNWQESDVLVEPDTDYLVVFKEDTTADTKTIQLLKLSDGSWQTENATARTAQIQGRAYYQYGNDADDLVMQISSWIQVLPVDAIITNVVNYFRSQYGAPLTETVNQYEMHDPRQTVIRMDSAADPMSSITLDILDQDRALVDPEDILVNLQITT